MPAGYVYIKIAKHIDTDTIRADIQNQHMAYCFQSNKSFRVRTRRAVRQRGKDRDKICHNIGGPTETHVDPLHTIYLLPKLL